MLTRSRACNPPGQPDLPERELVPTRSTGSSTLDYAVSAECTRKWTRHQTLFLSSLHPCRILLEGPPSTLLDIRAQTLQDISAARIICWTSSCKSSTRSATERNSFKLLFDASVPSNNDGRSVRSARSGGEHPSQCRHRRRSAFRFYLVPVSRFRQTKEKKIHQKETADFCIRHSSIHLAPGTLASLRPRRSLAARFNTITAQG